VALRVVQCLEVVEVDEQKRARVAAPLAGGDGLRHAVQEHTAVGQPRQRIEIGQFLDFHFVPLAY
jgi:hypothetical protein